MNATSPFGPRLEVLRHRSLMVGFGALALCAAGGFANATQFFRSYLLGYVFWTGVALGSMAVVMLHHLVGGGWGFVIRRLVESAMGTFALLAVLFLPVALGLSRLYLWARPEAVAADAVLQGKHVYLNVPFFLGRSVFYFLVWTILAHLLNKWSLEQDRAKDPSLLDRLQALSGPGLVLYGLTVTFASVDWAMSLEPHWFSTIYGMLFMVVQVLAALALVIILLMLLADREPLSAVISPNHFHDLGNLLLTFVMLWAYLSFSQYLIIWSGNLREEIPWYVRRSTGRWAWLAVFLIVFHFAVPFLLLLSREVKRRRQVLGWVAIALLFMSLVDLFWLLAPAYQQEGPRVHWMDILAPIGVGGIWMWAFLSRLRTRPLLPLGDPRFEQAAGHGD